MMDPMADIMNPKNPFSPIGDVMIHQDNRQPSGPSSSVHVHEVHNVEEQLRQLVEKSARRERFALVALVATAVVHWIASFRICIVYLPAETSLIAVEILFCICVVCRFIADAPESPLSGVVKKLGLCHVFTLLLLLVLLMLSLIVQIGHLTSLLLTHKLVACLYVIGLFQVCFTALTVYKAYRSRLRLTKFEKTGKLRYVI